MKFFSFFLTYLRLLLPPNIFWLRNCFNEIKGQVLYPNYLYRKWIIHNFQFSSVDFHAAFQELIRGLSIKDIETLTLILCRIKHVIKNSDSWIDLFTPEEKKRLQEFNFNLKFKVLEFANDLYQYENYYLPINNFEPSVFFEKHGIDTLKNKSYFHNKDIIDVGGYIGDSILILAPLTTRKVYSFEPAPNNYQLMLRTLQLNKIANAVPENFALGNSCETLKLTGSGAGCTFYPSSCFCRSIPVSMQTLDSYVEKHKLEVGLIKVDIEGAEQDFLAGAKQTICRDKPTLLISIYHNIQDLLYIKPMLESWNLGYSFSIFKPLVSNNIVCDTLLIAETVSTPR